MKIAFFDTHNFDRAVFQEVNKSFGHDITYFEPRLTAQTAPFAQGFDCLCCFVNDELDAKTLARLSQSNHKLIALRSAGYNNVDLNEASRLGMTVVRVPAYSPHAVAEHAVALLLTLNRKIHKAYSRVHELNFSLEGLVGFDIYQKTVGVIGTGKIGASFANIMAGFGCNVLAYDPYPNQALLKQGTVKYVELDELYRSSDIISLHTPLTPETDHLINSNTLGKMKSGVIIINTGRGRLIDTRALIDSLKTDHIGGAALDVYEEEEGVFFQDLSEKAILDDVLARLIMFPNVIITSHQGFLTKEALHNIAQTTLQNILDFQHGKELVNAVTAEQQLHKTPQ